jgi:membrane protein DedA with SNARE-associated domain
VIVIVGYVILKAGFGVPAAFIAIMLASFVVSLIGYEVIRRANVLRLLFGMKAVRRSRTAPATEVAPRADVAGIALRVPSAAVPHGDGVARQA